MKEWKRVGRYKGIIRMEIKSQGERRKIAIA